MPAPRFQSDRGHQVRRARPWNRLAYVIAALPAGLEELVPALEVPAGGRVLDYGSADGPYRRFFAEGVEFVTADLPGNPDADLEIRPDGTVPVESDSFDAVLSTQVLEHVEQPGVHLVECFRVLRPGGRLLLSTHGMMVYHPDPEDYWRWTGAGLKRVVASAGFELVRFEGIMGLAATGLQFVQDAFYYRLPRVPRVLLALTVQTLIRVADRLESTDGRRLNALVFALVARKP